MSARSWCRLWSLAVNLGAPTRVVEWLDDQVELATLRERLTREARRG